MRALVRHPRLRRERAAGRGGHSRERRGRHATDRSRDRARSYGFERIVLAGFSQGGAIALHTALREPRSLGRRARALDLPAARRHPGCRAQRRERGSADLHGARLGGSAATARARRGLAAHARGLGLRRRLARLPDAAQRVRRGDRRDRGVASATRRLRRSAAARSRTISRTSPVSRAAGIERTLGERQRASIGRSGSPSSSACRRPDRSRSARCGSAPLRESAVLRIGEQLEQPFERIGRSEQARDASLRAGGLRPVDTQWRVAERVHARR